jgi:hypothetical protein
MKKRLAAAATMFSFAALAVPAVVITADQAGASSAGAQFATDRQTMNAASSAFIQAFNAWERGGGSFSATSSFVGKYVSAIVSEDHKLLTQNWPAGGKTDIDSLVRGDAAVEGVVGSLPVLPSSTTSESEWFVTYDQDVASAVADANIVREDLGLPLASSS